MPPLDEYGRPVIAPEVQSAISAALAAIPEGKRGALLLIADTSGARGMLAAKIAGDWKVAAGGGVTWVNRRPYGYVAIEGAW